ncbi:unnamed protein product, partial [Meganyctiphanes norvegica]
MQLVSMVPKGIINGMVIALGWVIFSTRVITIIDYLDFGSKWVDWSLLFFFFFLLEDSSSLSFLGESSLSSFLGESFSSFTLDFGDDLLGVFFVSFGVFLEDLGVSFWSFFFLLGVLLSLGVFGSCLGDFLPGVFFCFGVA